MGIFSFFKKAPPYNDPLFGPMEWHKSGFWSGKTLFDESNIEILVPGDINSTFADTHLYFQELISRYPDLKKDIAKELFDLYSNYQENIAGKEENIIPKIESAESIWEHTNIVAIGISGSSSSNFEAELSYEMDWDENHSFDAHICNWIVEGIAING